MVLLIYHYLKSLKHLIMKSYKQLFKEKGFVFGETSYGDNSFTMNYYNLVKDILEGVHGDVPSPSELSSMFGGTVHLEYDSMPVSVKERKLYKPLGDIYVLTNKDIKGFSSAINRIGKIMNKEVCF